MMKKYNVINNVFGWLIFVVAAVTYLLTIEPTASFWDCPEFIAQAMKSEVGHPPGNPIFILAGRFAANFAGGDVMAVARCVNAMSALLSAGTILLLFWTITHMVKKLVVRDDENMTLAQYVVVMGSGVCGALAYTWSDTFWFSAVEAEVYAFSSFCTALVVWLMLKWEDRADEPDSDRWLILIAYVFGFSLGVHLLNLLCIPALALIFYYRKFKNTSVKGSLVTLLVSFAVIVVILWGLEPGFVELSGYFDLFAVNVLGLPYNTGVIVYALLTLAVMCWAIWELRKGTNDTAMRLSFFLTIFISGIPFIGDSWFIPVVILLVLAAYIFRFMKRVPTRIFANVVLSIMMIFVGFSCYGLILIRSNANTPLDENSPGDMFALSKYLSRDQYGQSPLVYGQVYTASPEYQSNGNTASTHMKKGARQWARVATRQPGEPDRYKMTGYAETPVYPSKMCMLFPRMWSSNSNHVQYYNNFFDTENNPFPTVSVNMVVDQHGNPDLNYQQSTMFLPRPTQWDNLKFFFGYQLNYMYFRYFMWNFAGRQNDIQGLYGEAGDVTRGNWITGISAFDNARLGDQSLLPADHTTGNKGHNVFYCLPLLLGIIGLLWQAFAGKRGIEQFWVVFFLFFMTGIAIVLYLNQTPLQPRERDYAYAGSFYAWTIWVGMGVAAIWSVAMRYLKGGKKAKADDGDDTEHKAGTASVAVAAVAAVIGLLVPLQMVSQTWDDHDRSGRYACRDFGMNYLSSLDPNAIIFTNGDNDTFPLWYLQEVEGYRTDVRVVNLSYLATDWYISQMQRSAYDSKPLPMQAGAGTYAYENRQGTLLTGSNDARMTVTDMLKGLYNDELQLKKAAAQGSPSDGGSIMGIVDNNNLYIPANADAAVKAGIIKPEEREQAVSSLDLDLAAAHSNKSMSSSDMMVLDIINSSIQQGWKRPTYFASTVDNNLYKVFTPYLRNCGMAYQVTPIRGQDINAINPVCNTDKMYRNVTKLFRWGGLDKAKNGGVYLDETVRRMVNTTRSMMLDLAGDLAAEAELATSGSQKQADCVDKALNVLKLMDEKMSETACPYSFVIFGQEYVSVRLAQAKIYEQLSKTTGRAELHKKAVALAEADALYYAPYVVFSQSISGTGLGAAEFDGIVQDYYPRLMLYSKTINPDGYDALLAKLKKKGLSDGTVHGMIQALLQYQQLRYQQAQQAAAPAQEPQQPADDGEQDDEQGLMGLQGGVPGFGSEDEQQ